MAINPNANIEAVNDIIEAKSVELQAKKCSVEDIIKEICSIYQLKNPSTRISSRPKAKANYDESDDAGSEADEKAQQINVTNVNKDNNTIVKDE